MFCRGGSTQEMGGFLIWERDTGSGRNWVLKALAKRAFQVEKKRERERD